MTVPPAEEVDRKARARLEPIEDASRRGDSEVQRFYQGAVVLVTGGSGFLGKQLIEKLFRTFDLKKVYVLLRAKKGKSVEQRLQQILSNPVYDSVRETKPWFPDRIQAIEGDIKQHRLGVGDDMWQRLVDEVNIVFHNAATVSFVEPLKVAVEVNVKGTIEMLEFGKACKHLTAFVHVSTAYSQAVLSRNNKDIAEEFTTSPMDPDGLIALANSTDQETMDEIGAKLGIGSEHPNTYSYTKAVAEEAVRRAAQDLPICVLRPTIVVPAFTEPSPGWTDINNVLGGSGVILGLSLGITHTLLADEEIIIDFIPVDLVNNAAILVGFETARRYRLGERDCKIYTIGSSGRNALKYAMMTSVFKGDARRHITPQAVGYAFAVLTTNKLFYYLLSWLLHFIPGYIADVVLILMGKKPQATKIYRLIYRHSTVVGLFMCHSWRFRDDNTLRLYSSLGATDQEIFNIDIAKVDMKELILLWNIGLRKFILKESLGNEEQALRKQLMLKIATYILAPLYLYTLYKIVVFVLYGLFCLVF